MPNEKVAGLPEQLAQLLEPTPSSVTKLIAAWDGLNTESQMLILSGLDTARLPPYLAEKVRIKALESATAYVRYLAARRLHFGRDDTEEKKAVKQRIEEDPNPLVRYCLLESGWGLFRRDLGDADAFFTLPHEARLATIRQLHGSGEAMANLIGHAVDHQLKDGRVSAIEVFEILSDYVNKNEFKKHYDADNESYDGVIEYGRGKDIDFLWRLVLKVPEGISHILIENLPPGAGLSLGIPDDVLSGMSDGQLTTLFSREDIHLRELRKKLFFEAGDERGEVKLAAIRYNFDLDYTEFGTILASPKSEARTILGYLRTARNLSLCLYKAIHDVSMQTDMFDALDAEFAAKALDRRLEELTGWERKKQLRDLNLYQLAKTAAPWKKGEEGYLPSGELEFLSKAVMEGDTWSTFIAYSNVRAENSPNFWKLEKYLSRFEDPGMDEAGQANDDEGENERTELLDRVEEKLTDAVSSLTESAEVKQIELKECLKDLSKDFSRLEAAKERQTQLLDEHIAKLASTTIGKADETKKQVRDILDELTTDVTGIQATQERQSLLLYLVVGLLVWLLIKIL
jgi:hypothetical protein